MILLPRLQARWAGAVTAILLSITPNGSHLISAPLYQLVGLIFFRVAIQGMSDKAFQSTLLFSYRSMTRHGEQSSANRTIHSPVQAKIRYFSFRCNKPGISWYKPHHCVQFLVSSIDIACNFRKFVFTNVNTPFIYDFKVQKGFAPSCWIRVEERIEG